MKAESKHIIKLISHYPELDNQIQNIKKAIRLLHDCYKSNTTIYTCGNGGSASDAEHIVGELMKGFALKRELSLSEVASFENLYSESGKDICKNLQQGIPAISLVSNAALTTAILNDLDPAYLFAQQVYSLGKKGDVLIAISTSGNSRNVINAAKVALAKEISVVSLTGNSGGELNTHSTITIKAPSNDVARIQEYHLPIYHCICLALEELCFGD
ncbi:SIS domain-containing protein [Amylibacter sp.]|nr:SIS domain-containing protein [Amylibacter sp.]